MAAVDVFRGYVKLLGAIVEKADWDDLWLRFGLVPPGEKRCLGCGKLIPEYSQGHKTSDYCPECWEKRHFVTLKCGQCGKEFKLSRSDYNARLRKRKVPLFFCSKRCWGAYVAQHYGFGVHPEHIGKGSRKRKGVAVMPKVEEAIEKLRISSKERVKRSQTVLEYLDNHPDEVFRPADKEELAIKVGLPKPGAIPHAFIELVETGKIGKLRIKGGCFYGSHVAIEKLKAILPQEWVFKGKKRHYER